jgi:hypothetical protein
VPVALCRAVGLPVRIADVSDGVPLKLHPPIPVVGTRYCPQ